MKNIRHNVNTIVKNLSLLNSITIYILMIEE